MAFGRPSSLTLLKEVNAVLYYAGWVACVMGAQAGRPGLGLAVVALFTAYHLAIVPAPLREAAFLALAALLGFGVDTGQALIGAFSFAGQSYPWLAPPWMVVLWVNFATVYHWGLAVLRGRYWIAALLGAIGGPLAYDAGAALGPITLGQPFVYTQAVIAVAWGLATPFLLWLSARLVPAPLLTQSNA